jgi:heptosyltransferase-2
MSERTAPRSILVVRLSSLGDVVLTTPVFACLRRAYPESRVAVLVKAAYVDVFQGNPHVDEVLVFESRGFWGWLKEIRARRFSLYLDLHDTFRSRLWGFFSNADRRARYDKQAWERRRLVWFKRPALSLKNRVTDRYLDALRTLNIPVTESRPRLHISAARRLSPEWERRLGPGLFLGIAPGALHATKRWPAPRFAEAADRLARLMQDREKQAVKILLFGAKSDEPTAREVLCFLRGPAVSLVGETSVQELMLLIQRCSLFLTNDSGAMHVASALEVPTVAVFGPTVREFGFFPTSDNAAVLETNGLPCRPCSLHGGKSCPQGHFRCMEEISVDRVVETGRNLLRRSSLKAAP